MVHHKSLVGKYISLKPVSIEDAEFILKLRLDNEKNKYIHKTPNNIEAQREWIENQRSRSNDYYFLILNKEQKPLGTISLYNLERSSGELGRWISYGNAYENLESVLLLHQFAYQILNLESVYTCTKVENKKVIRFWNKFGSDQCEEIEVDDWTASKNSVFKSTFYESIFPRICGLLNLD